MLKMPENEKEGILDCESTLKLHSCLSILAYNLVSVFGCEEGSEVEIKINTLSVLFCSKFKYNYDNNKEEGIFTAINMPFDGTLTKKYEGLIDSMLRNAILNLSMDGLENIASVKFKLTSSGLPTLVRNLGYYKRDFYENWKFHVTI